MKTAIITGCTSGIGEATAKALISKGFKVYAFVRNTIKAKAVFGETAMVVSCDLEDFESIKKAAEVLIAEDFKIDVLINNAGAMFQKRQTAVSGHEKTLMVNYIGPFYLTQLLMPKLLKCSTRVINLSSAVHPRHKVNWEDLELQNKYSGITAYANAKLYILWYTKLLHSKYHKHGLTAFAVHPGLIGSNFGDNLGAIGKLTWRIMKLFIKSNNQGAESSIFLSTAEKVDHLSGKYVVNKTAKQPDSYADDLDDASRLWKISEKWCPK
jgi:NAD(P)-dependent dehydrogenase (short-subunit alcohol dehydrogenase family)